MWEVKYFSAVDSQQLIPANDGEDDKDFLWLCQKVFMVHLDDFNNSGRSRLKNALGNRSKCIRRISYGLMESNDGQICMIMVNELHLVFFCHIHQAHKASCTRKS